MSDPHRAQVQVEINIHQALAAIEYFAANYPPERAATNHLCEASPYAVRLRAAADVIDRRCTAFLHDQPLTVQQARANEASLPCVAEVLPSVLLLPATLGTCLSKFRDHQQPHVDSTECIGWKPCQS